MFQPTPQTPIENNLTKKDIITPILLSVAVVLGIGVGLKLKNEPLVTVAPKEKIVKPEANDLLGQGRIEEILRYVNAKYVDGVNDKLMIDKSVNGLLQELDPHSVYIPADNIKEVNEDLEGEFEGIGIESILLDDTLRIVTPLSNSPAANAGLLTGDKIIVVSDSSAVGKNMRWLHEKLRGKKGSTVKISIQREDESRLKTLTLTRDRVPVHAVDVATTLDNQTGYIKISRFSANTTREFLQGLEKLYEKKNVKDLVIDLRQNPGGYLDKAVDILSQLFKDKDKLLVYTKGRTVHRNEYKSSGRSRYEVGNVAILIDEGSASASEIVAGAVQDWDRGVVIGRRSFGKGLVQEPYILKDGSELRLTVARYYTPTGRSIQKPYKNRSKKEYADEEDKRFEHGTLTREEPDPQTDSSRYYTAAGRLVYGGGGVKPDYFVPIDPIVKNDYFNLMKPWIQEYAYRYYSTYRKELKFSDWQEYQRNFKVSDYAFNDFIKYTERQDVKRQADFIPALKDPIRKLLKARIARLMFGEEGYYGILNDNDPMILLSLEVLRQKDPLNLGKIARKQ
jgi:carboxyl-terminal processing protease